MDVFAQLKEAIKEAERLAQQERQGGSDWSQAPAAPQGQPPQGFSQLAPPPSAPPAPAGFSQLGAAPSTPAPASFSQVGAPPPPAPRRQQGRRKKASHTPQPQPTGGREFQAPERCEMEDHFAEARPQTGPRESGLLANLRGDRLREAILLREVLGPPPGLLDD